MPLPACHLKALEKKALFYASRTSSAATDASQQDKRISFDHGSNCNLPKVGFFGGKFTFASLILKGYICVSALKTDSLVGGSLLEQLGLII